MRSCPRVNASRRGVTTMSQLAWAGLLATVCALLAWGEWLMFCVWLVRFTGSSECLKDAAVVARSFRAPRSTGPVGPTATGPLVPGVHNEVLAAAARRRRAGVQTTVRPGGGARTAPGRGTGR
ncbi:hypothetical protein FB474_0685 [Oryzihumus leptocrescens]|uniref:Uncharacterized protein n=2 Tax=Oryzihumus leptocrescens TaxID=297536 RepID=A0A542ZG75_9MICO|nr:hypothetical protein FB474_0685 [Oryzihumus leptocrescens]